MKKSRIWLSFSSENVAGNLLFGNRGHHQPKRREKRDRGEDREEVLPVAEDVHREDGDNRTHERRDGLHDLSRRERAGKRFARHDIRQQRIERHLQDRVADSQQREGHHAGREIIRYERNQHADDRDDVADLDGAFASDAVHCQCYGDREQQEPEEYHRRNESGEGFAEVEIVFDIGGRDADHVAESHHEEAEKDGHYFGYGGFTG